MGGSTFKRPHFAELVDRLREPRRRIHVLGGARQVGKTTLVLQVLEHLGVPHRYASADQATLRLQGWIERNWEEARELAKQPGDRGAILVLDEVQQIQQWSTEVKRMWDEDTRSGLPLKVVLLGSAPLLVGQGLTESLTGRFEMLRLPHWSFDEMSGAFGWDVETYIYFGGYPGSADQIGNEGRWKRLIRDMIIETTVSRDVLLNNRVMKPALLRQLLEQGCQYSAQIVTYTKLLGSLHDAGNSTTLAHYLDLLAEARLLTGLVKHRAEPAIARRGSPKLQVFNTALSSALSEFTFDQTREDRPRWGRLTESAVGAHLANAMAQGECKLSYWRENRRGREVDFVIKWGPDLLAIEVKSGRTSGFLSGLGAFAAAHRGARTLLVGGSGVPVREFLQTPVQEWLRGSNPGPGGL